MLSCGLNRWRGTDFYPKQGWSLHYSRDLSYFSVRLSFKQYSLWLLAGWGWMWCSRRSKVGDHGSH